MIAPQRVAAPARHVERVTRATRRRKRRSRVRSGRAGFVVLGLALAVLIPLLSYVKLTSDLTSMNYALASARDERTQLLEESQRLDNRISGLTSADRLEHIAAQLKMHDPQVYAVVTLPAIRTQPKPSGIAFFGWITHHER